jgi:hypothetical protein
VRPARGRHPADVGVAAAIDHSRHRPAEYEIRYYGVPPDMTLHEYRLLHTFVKQPQRVFTHEELLAQCWEAPEYRLDRAGTVLFDSYQLDVGKNFAAWRDVALTLQGRYVARSSPKDPRIRGSKQRESSSTAYIALERGELQQQLRETPLGQALASALEDHGAGIETAESYFTRATAQPLPHPRQPDYRGRHRECRARWFGIFISGLNFIPSTGPLHL